MSVWHYVVCQDCREYVNLERTNLYQCDPRDFEMQNAAFINTDEASHMQRALHFVMLHNGHRLMIVNEFEFEQYANGALMSMRDDFKEVLTEDG